MDGTPLALVNNGTVYYPHPDRLGTVQRITDAGQQVVWSARYEPFGQAVIASGIEYNPRFPGQYYDAETGLYYNHFRDYDAGVGRYAESDPIGLGGGVNTYAYAKNNPLNFNDPTGEAPEDLFKFSPLIKFCELLLHTEPYSPEFAACDENPQKCQNSLFHYTNKIGMQKIIESQELLPSLKSINPNDVRYGNGQYLSDIAPGTMSCAQLSRCFLGQPFQGQRFTNFIEISIDGLSVIQGRKGVFVIPNETTLDLAGQIIRYGRN